MKTCKICKIEKPLTEYAKHKECKDGLMTFCRSCLSVKRQEWRERTGNATTKKYEKTKSGFLMRMYRNMKSRISGIQSAKYHLYANKDILSKEDFYSWAKDNKQFDALFNLYEQSNYNMKLAPSIDRIDSSKGYVISNMQFITHSENSKKGSISRHEKYRERAN